MTPETTIRLPQPAVRLAPVTERVLGEADDTREAKEAIGLAARQRLPAPAALDESAAANPESVKFLGGDVSSLQKRVDGSNRKAVLNGEGEFEIAVDLAQGFAPAEPLNQRRDLHHSSSPP